MKKILLMLCVVSLAACSKDDDTPSKKLVPTTITIVGEAGSTFTETVNLTYDSKRRISSLSGTGNGNGVYTIHYANNKEISEIDYAENNASNVTTLAYDSHGRVASFSSQGNTTDVTYYDDGSFSIETLQFAYNNAGDFTKYGTNTFAYDTSKKGSFANVSAFSPLIMILMDARAFFYANHKALTGTTSTDNSFSYSIENTYDEKGYVQQATLSGTEDVTISYTYESL